MIDYIFESMSLLRRCSDRRVFREVIRCPLSFSTCPSNADAETVDEWLRSFAFAWNQLI